MQRKMLSLMGVLVLAIALVGPLGGRTAYAVTGREPVIIIPGVAGSEFVAGSAFYLSVNNGHGGTYTHNYGAGETVWVNTWEAAALGDDDYFDALKLQSNGATPVAPALRVGDIYHSAYDDLIGYLQGQGYSLGVDLWVFPYDWRRDIRNTAAELDALVTRALVATNGGRTDPATWTIRRADIVGHSMGGLVARYYISDAARANRIDQVITLGSPQLGATKFLKALIYGDNFGPSFLGIGLNSDEIKDLVQNMTGGWELLPSRPYYTYYDNSDSSRLRPYVEDRDFDGNGSAGGVLSYSGARQLLLNLGKNSTTLNLSETYHDALDGQRNGGVNGVRWVALIGYGYGTLGQIREYTGSCWSWYHYVPCAQRDETPVDGDGTVAVMSAAMGDPWRNILINSGAQLWYVQREHGDLVKRDYVLGVAVSDGPVLPWIGDLLRGAIAMSATTSDVTAADTASVTRAPTQQLSGTWISALGPVALQVRDAGGNTTGRARGAAEAAPAAIPGSSHERLPDGEFAFVKHDTPYTINVAAERAGSVDLKVRVLGGGRVERTALYLGVRLGANGSARLAIAPGTGRAAAAQGWPALAIDADGDGIFEASVPASAVLDARESADRAAPNLVVDLPKQGAGTRGVTLRWRATDQGAGMLRESAVIDAGSPAQRAVANGETVVLAAGQHRLLVTAVDRAGNARGREVVFTVR